MELKKRKYKKAEVEAYINSVQKKNDAIIIELRDKIRDLIRENNDLKTQVETYTEKEELLVAVLLRAEASTKEVEKSVQLQYDLEVERLKNFSKKWDKYFKDIKEKYPRSTSVKKALNVKNELDTAILKKAKSKEIIDNLDKAIDGKQKKFSPKDKINDYIATTSDNGFNLNDVLNPGALKLEDLCKELGLTEENE